MRFCLESNFKPACPDCSLQDLREAFLDILRDSDEFLVLSPEKRIDPVLQVQFIQSVVDEPDGIRVEVKLRHAGQWRLVNRYYDNPDEVWQIYENFYTKNLLPDLRDYDLAPEIYQE